MINWREVSMAYFKVLEKHLPGINERCVKKTHRMSRSNSY
jgi:hypothetical protein